MNHSMACLGLAHIYLNQREDLHLWCELIKLTWLSPAWLLQLRKRREPNYTHLSKWKGVLSRHEAHSITQHRSCLPRAPGKGVSLLPTATENTRPAKHRGFHENHSSVPSASLHRSLKGLPTKEFPVIAFCLTLGSSWHSNRSAKYICFFSI